MLNPFVRAEKSNQKLTFHGGYRLKDSKRFSNRPPKKNRSGRDVAEGLPDHQKGRGADHHGLSDHSKTISTMLHDGTKSFSKEGRYPVGADKLREDLPRMQSRWNQPNGGSENNTQAIIQTEMSGINGQYLSRREDA